MPASRVLCVPGEAGGKTVGEDQELSGGALEMKNPRL